ncbi:antitoxin [Intrasporangium calvum]|uniref:Antitoxin n=1 Tax=Intrasporangium calvum TaxID=53358 RepID=A0ABT5GLZ0_9MICO|nr:antitoxin [Intrasporangium calvum]MDC5699263.1 antitoxin [Intrasporangium calvum]
MGMFDNMADKVSDLVEQNQDKIHEVVNDHGDTIGDGIDRAGDFVDDKTGGRFSDHIGTGEQHVKDAIDGLDGQNDDIP